MHIDVIMGVLPLLLGAAGVTIYVSLAAMMIGITLGIGVSLLHQSSSKVLSWFAAVFISFFRGVPPLVQLLLAYVLLPVIGINLPVTAMAILVLGLGSTAYVAEIYRGAFLANGRGQREAAEALGFTEQKIWIRIVIPQATRVALPALVNELILLLKASSLLSVVGVTELTRVGQTSAASTYRPLEVFLATAAVYLAMNTVIAVLGRACERRLSIS